MKPILLSLIASVGLVASPPSLVAGPESYSSKNLAAAPPSAEVFDWSGLYGGLNVGGHFSHRYFDLGFDLRSHPEDTALVGGGQLGLNLQWGHFVLGVEGDFQGSSDNSVSPFNITFTSPVSPTTGTVSFRREVNSQWFASARGRIGSHGIDSCSTPPAVRPLLTWTCKVEMSSRALSSPAL